MVKSTYANLVLFCAITGSSVVASPLQNTLDRRGKDFLNKVQSGRVTKPNNSGGLGSYQPTPPKDGKDEHERYWQTPGTPPSRPYSPAWVGSGPMSGVSYPDSGRGRPMSGVQYHRRDLFESVDDLVERDDFELERRGKDKKDKDPLKKVQNSKVTKPNDGSGLGSYQPTQPKDGKDEHERYWQTPGTPPDRAYSPAWVGSAPMSGVSYPDSGRGHPMSDVQHHGRDLFESIDDLVERDDFEFERRGKDFLNKVQSGRVTKPNNSGGLGSYQPTPPKDGKDEHERYWQTPGTPPSRPYSPAWVGSGPMSGVSYPDSGRGRPMSGVQYHRRDMFESIDDLV